MDDLQTLEVEIEGGKETNTPTFLKVLCVLSWVMAGLSSFSLIAGLFTLGADKEYQVDMLLDQRDEMADLMGEDSIFAQMMDMSIEMLDYQGLALIISFLTIVLGSIFVYMMYKLKKTGFYLYSGLHILVGLAPLFYLTINGGLGLAVAINLVITGVFILLYGLNVKHMKY